MPLIEKLQALGEQEVNRQLLAGEFGSPGSLDYQRAAGVVSHQSELRRDARDERTLSIAKRAETIAIAAIVFSTIMAIIQILATR